MAWVDAAKGMSILLVVAHHSVMFLQASGLAPAAVGTANTALASMRMPLFFLASGLFVAGPLAASWRTLLHKRVALFLYLYLLWTLLRFAFFQIPAVDALDPYETSDPVTTLAWALVLPGSLTWFLYALALFAVVCKLIRRVPVWLQLSAAGLLSALAGAEVVEFESGPWTRIVRYFLFFLLGWHARRLVQQIAARSSLATVVAAAGGCVGAAAVAVALDLQPVPGVALALNIAAVAFGVAFAAWISRYRIGRPLVALGRQTLPVYLLHIFWIAGCMIALQELDVPVVAEYLLPVVLTVLFTALSLMTHRLLVGAGCSWLFALPSRLAHRPSAAAAS
ncbi:MAG: acyltransferase family protein [Pseudonocardia sp.]